MDIPPRRGARGRARG